MRLCFIVLDHCRDRYSEDLVNGIRMACPEADVVWYDSGGLGDEELVPGVPRLPVSRPQYWGKSTAFFFDFFDWAAGTEYDYFVNVETDMMFVKRGFFEFIEHAMLGFDYMAPHFRRASHANLHWGPYRRLKVGDLPTLLSILGMRYTNRCFTPGQVFSAKYVSRVVASAVYPDVIEFVQRCQASERSRSLQEILLPTLADRFDLDVRDYPADGRNFNRWRPYWSLDELADLANSENAYFVHPIRRDDNDYARLTLRSAAEETLSA